MFTLDRFRQAAKYEGCITRRLFLAYSGALSSIPFVTPMAAAQQSPNFPADPFSLGVASGDPDHRSVVLWTRLAPYPLQPAGGMPQESVEVHWEIAADESMKSTISKGIAVASPQLGHSVHVEAAGLKPDRWYWYRFRAGDAKSPVGRTRTLPNEDVLPNHLRFAVTSCQNYEQGLFTAYDQMARDDVDLVVHLGDYIYEYESGRNGKVRTHFGKELQSLDDYRARLSQYRSDPLLNQMHAVCPWLVTWDDHEFDNNCAGDISEESDVNPVDFLERRANAYQAYYEMMPLRRRSIPRGSDMRLYRNANYGRLANLLVLDTRQYRTDQPNDDKRSPLNDAAVKKENSLLGRTQKNWLSRELITSTSQWNVLAQQVMMGMVNRNTETDQALYSMDQWPGYAYERMQLMHFLKERRIRNPVVLTGDIHSNWVNELRIDDRNQLESIVATEFVGTSLSSGGNGRERPDGLDTLLSRNPCVKFHNAERGYVLCTVTPEVWRSDYKVVDDVLKPGGNTTVRASFSVESGDPSVKVT